MFWGFSRKVSYHHSRGFSLVELMIVVGIVGILATIAIPKMQAFVIRSRRAEVDLAFRGMSQFVAAQAATEPDGSLRPWIGDWDDATVRSTIGMPSGGGHFSYRLFDCTAAGTPFCTPVLTAAAKVGDPDKRDEFATIAGQAKCLCTDTILEGLAPDWSASCASRYLATIQNFPGYGTVRATSYNLVFSRCSTGNID